MIPQLSQDILRYLRVHSETQRLALLPISLSRTRAHSPRGPPPPPHAVDTVDSVTRPIPQSNCYEGMDGKQLSQCGHSTFVWSSPMQPTTSTRNTKDADRVICFRNQGREESRRQRPRNAGKRVRGQNGHGGRPGSRSRRRVSKSDQTASEKVSVFAHGRGAVLGNRMSIHTIRRKRHFGSTE